MTQKKLNHNYNLEGVLILRLSEDHKSELRSRFERKLEPHIKDNGTSSYSLNGDKASVLVSLVSALRSISEYKGSAKLALLSLIISANEAINEVDKAPCQCKEKPNKQQSEALEDSSYKIDATIRLSLNRGNETDSEGTQTYKAIEKIFANSKALKRVCIASYRGEISFMNFLVVIDELIKTLNKNESKRLDWLVLDIHQVIGSN